MPPTPSPAAIRASLAPWIPFLLVAVPVLHVLYAPYTKVEESFTMHAVYDMLRYGPTSFASWDHRTFPGAVPRSFVPPILLALASWPTATVAAVTGMAASSIDTQQIVRITLAGAWAGSMLHLTRSLRVYSALTVSMFTILSVTQFHIPFYASRTIPNFLALPAVNLSISYTLRRQYWRAIALLTATATIVRLELALVVLPLAAVLVICGRMSLPSALGAGMAGGFGALGTVFFVFLLTKAISAPIDYALWAPTLPHPSLPTFTAMSTLWPELSAAMFNIVGGHADEWGVMPRTFYLFAIGKILLGGAPLVAYALAYAVLRSTTGVPAFADNKALWRCISDTGVLLPSVIVLIGALSSVGHKEWRFVVYAIPVFNILGAAGAAGLWSLAAKRLRALARLGVVGLILANIAFTLFSTYVSSQNYPGGDVWRVLETLDIKAGSTIHFPSYPLQTGSTLYTFIHANVPQALAFPAQEDPEWVYSKSEDVALLTPAGAAAAGVDYVVTSDWETFAGAQWKVVGSIDAYDGVRRGGKWGVYVATARKLAILHRE